MTDASLVFACPGALWLLLIAVPLSGWMAAVGRAPALVFSSVHLLRDLGTATRTRPWRMAAPIEVMIFVLIIVALARPQMQRMKFHSSESGVDIMLVLDATPTMLVEDFTIDGKPVSRVKAVTHLAARFISNRRHDRIGMIMFAGQPYLLSPLTLDHNWLIKSLERVEVREATAIGSAIAAAATRLDKSDARSRVIVLLTDGDNNSGMLSPATAAEMTGVLGIKIYTVGVGTNAELPVPGYAAKAILNEPLLRDVAKLGHGRYFRASDADSLERVFAEIDQLEKSELTETKVVETTDMFAWFAVPAWVLGSLTFLYRMTWGRTVP